MDILVNFMSETAFEAITTPDHEENPYEIWNSNICCYTSSSINNKGQVWLKFLQYEYKGILKEFIDKMHKMLLEIALVRLGIPDNILSFSILAKLSKDMYNVVNNIILNEVIVKRPSVTLLKLQEIVHIKESCKTRAFATLNKSADNSTEEQCDSAAALMHESKKGNNKNH